MTLLPEEIQPGWRVFDASGEELGTVIGIDPDVIRIQRVGVMGGVWRAPLDSVREIETGRIELGLTKEDLT
ncbi:MAG: DUF2171 domain-containing protein [Chloroflexota bacterium]